MELSPGFYPGSNEQHRLFWASTLEHIRSRNTSASSTAGVLNDNALHKSTYSLTHSQVPYVCPKCSPFCGGGDLDAHLKMVPLAHLSPHTKRHIDRSSHFCRTQSCVQQTNTHTDNPRNMGDKEQHLMLGTVTPISQSFIPGPARRYAPLMAVRSKNRGGPTSILGQVRSPHISGGWRWLTCRQSACLQPRAAVPWET